MNSARLLCSPIVKQVGWQNRNLIESDDDDDSKSSSCSHRHVHEVSVWRVPKNHRIRDSSKVYNLQVYNNPLEGEVKYAVV